MNLIQNFSNDHNLLSYGLLLGSVAILGYSIYYFTGYLTTVNTGSQNLLNTETFTQRLVENLDNYQHLNLDNKVPTMSNFVDSISQGINTDGNQVVDSSVQTDDQMLYDYLRELLYNNATPSTSLAEISPSDFVREYRDNPEYAAYFDNTAKWSESIGDPRLFKTNSSEYNFLSKLREALGIDPSTSTIMNNVPTINEPIIPQT